MGKECGGRKTWGVFCRDKKAGKDGDYRAEMQTLFERDLLAAFDLEHPVLRYFAGGWRALVAARRMAGRVKRGGLDAGRKRLPEEGR